jgi:hypothetical protein
MIEEIRARMAAGVREEKLVEQKVTYTLLKEGKFYIVENVPARVNAAGSGHSSTCI